MNAEEQAAAFLASLGIDTSAAAAPPAAAAGADKNKSKQQAKKDEKSKGQSAAAKLALQKLEREKAEKERIAREEEEARRKEEEAERLQKEKEEAEKKARELKLQQRQEMKEKLRAEGKPVTKAEKQKAQEAALRRQQLIDQGLFKIDEQGNFVPVSQPSQPKKKDQKPKGDSKKGTEASSSSSTTTIAAPSKDEKSDEDEKEAISATTPTASTTAASASSASASASASSSSNDDDDDWDKVDVSLSNLNLKQNDEEEKVVLPVSSTSSKSAHTPAIAANTGASNSKAATSVAPAQPSTTAKSGTSSTDKAASEHADTKKKAHDKKDHSKKKDHPPKKGGKGASASKNDDDDEDDDEDEDDSMEEEDHERANESAEARKERIEAARARRKERYQKALATRNGDNLRSPIICVLGHVDTGKTSLLDKIRHTNVQKGEAAGITQQIGATNCPLENLKHLTDKIATQKKHADFVYKIPGLLIIDTPGHESFSNLRTRGSGLCDLAILVIDIMHGLEQQTYESIEILRKRKTNFVVALNKIDRLYGWKSTPDGCVTDSLAKQDEHTIDEFERRTKDVITQLMEKGLNAALYYKNNDPRSVVSLVPTSAHTGEGLPDLLFFLMNFGQKYVTERLMYVPDVECSVAEVKEIEGQGTTIDTVLVNGELHEGDKIVLAGSRGPIVTYIRSLLTPQPLREMRVKGDFILHQKIKGAIGVKIAAHHLETAIAGTSLYVVHEDDDVDELKELVMEDVSSFLSRINRQEHGVCVQASTLGSLEALIDLLNKSNVPVSGVTIGTVNKKDVTRASVMVERKPELAAILAFNVKVSKQARELAEELKVKIFSDETIYRLCDQFTNYISKLREEKKTNMSLEAVFPCILRIIPDNVFNVRNPIVVGVDVVEGICKVGTPIIVPDKEVPNPEKPGEMMKVELGRIASIEENHKAIDSCKKGSSCCIKIAPVGDQQTYQVGRQFTVDNLLYSKLTRASIDLLKENFEKDLSKEEWGVVKKIRDKLGIAAAQKQ